MFGLVTERRLRRYLAELEERDRKRDLEWSQWFDKFRHLYARLAKRLKDAGEAGALAADSGGPVSDATPGDLPFSRQWELAKLANRHNGGTE
jgi:hypothetical protein